MSLSCKGNCHIEFFRPNSMGHWVIWTPSLFTKVKKARQSERGGEGWGGGGGALLVWIMWLQIRCAMEILSPTISLTLTPRLGIGCTLDFHTLTQSLYGYYISLGFINLENFHPPPCYAGSLDPPSCWASALIFPISGVLLITLLNCHS